MGKLRVFRDGQMWKFVISFTPMLLAFTIACSRTMDYHNHFSDIVGNIL